MFTYFKVQICLFLIMYSKIELSGSTGRELFSINKFFKVCNFSKYIHFFIRSSTLFEKASFKSKILFTILKRLFSSGPVLSILKISKIPHRNMCIRGFVIPPIFLKPLNATPSPDIFPFCWFSDEKMQFYTFCRNLE